MLKQQLIDPSKYALKCPYGMTPKGLCIHNTANDAPAKNEISYMVGNNFSTSFHIAVDDTEAIQAIPFNRNAWHAGDGGNGEGNRYYISMEICYSKSGGQRFTNAEKRAAKEAAHILKQYGWGIANVKKHQDFSGKYCPHRTLDLGWQRFLNMIQAELNSLNAPATNTDQIYRIRKTWADAKSQVGAYRNLASAKNQCPVGYSVFDNAGNVVYANKPTPVHTYINLKPVRDTWAVYNVNGPYTSAYKVGDLAPKMYGGLSYHVLGNPMTDVYIIQTSVFGKVAIYVPKDNESSFTTSPLY